MDIIYIYIYIHNIYIYIERERERDSTYAGIGRRPRKHRKCGCILKELLGTTCHRRLLGDDLQGGYFNPAVTLSVMLNGRQKCSVKQGLPFIATQIFCAAFAAFVYTAIRSPSTFPVMPVESIEKYGRLHMAVVDAIFAFFVCYVALATITVVGVKANLKRNYYDGLAFGLASAAGGFSLIRLQNSLANPALTLGLSLSYVATFTPCCMDIRQVTNQIYGPGSQPRGEVWSQGRDTRSQNFQDRHPQKHISKLPSLPNTQDFKTTRDSQSLKHLTSPKS